MSRKAVNQNVYKVESSKEEKSFNFVYFDIEPYFQII